MSKYLVNKFLFTVDRDRVLQFCDAIGEDNPIFRDPAAAKEAGYDEQLAPPTFPTVMQIMTRAVSTDTAPHR